MATAFDQVFEASDRIKALLAAGFTDDQVDILCELFEPLKPRKVVKTRKVKYRPDDFDFAQEMYRLILAKFPDTKPPNIDQWADDLRKMREIDKLDAATIANVFSWAHHDSFWSANIRSPGKLRKQWEQLCAKKQTEAGNGPNPHI